MLLGGVSISSTTHVILAVDSGDGATAEACSMLREGLCTHFGKSPMVVPWQVWVRSCELHKRPDNGE